MSIALSVPPAPVRREAFVGTDHPTPLFDGRLVPYVNLDNAASTPAFASVVNTIEEFLPYYSGVHRGTGYKSRISTAAFDRARELVGQFVGADPDADAVIFTKNTTEAINKLAGSLRANADAVVLTTLLEHHSNDLPWRSRFRTVHIALTADGRLDLDDLDRRIREHAGQIALLAVSGASNVTGAVQQVHDLARRIHAVDGRIFVDAAQLAPHRCIDMLAHDDPGHLDFVAFSAHKMYAPFGTGVLVGARDAFAETPEHSGGGTVHAVTTDSVAWAELPDREEAGSPNVVGAVALAAAMRELAAIGLDRIAQHECQVTAYALARLAEVRGLTLLGSRHTDRVGVIPFVVDGFDHGLVAAILGYEHGIGVRSGCFCAHPYVAHLLDLDDRAAMAWAQNAARGDKRGAPGMVRISLGCYNDADDVDRAVDGLHRLVAGEVGASYALHRDGSYHPRGYVEPMLFRL